MKLTLSRPSRRSAGLAGISGYAELAKKQKVFQAEKIAWESLELGRGWLPQGNKRILICLSIEDHQRGDSKEEDDHRDPSRLGSLSLAPYIRGHCVLQYVVLGWHPFTECVVQSKVSWPV